MKKSKVEIQRLENGLYRVCTPYGGVCVDTASETRAKAVADAIYRSIHFDMRASRSSNQ